jgi:hypothetical protein
MTERKYVTTGDEQPGEPVAPPDEFHKQPVPSSPPPDAPAPDGPSKTPKPPSSEDYFTN